MLIISYLFTHILYLLYYLSVLTNLFFMVNNESVN